MKQFNSIAVRNEVMDMHKNQSCQATGADAKSFKLSWELPAALFALGAIIAAVFILSHYGLIGNV
jgi:hypothetical protein